MKKSLRDLMVESVSFMASGMDRKGLSAKKVRAAEYHIKNWKYYFVKYMALNPLNESGAAFLETAPTSYPMGIKTATLLADKTILNLLDQENRAIDEGSFGPYFERTTLSWVEYGRVDEMPYESPDEDVRSEVIERTKELGIAKYWTPDDRKKKNYSELLILMINNPTKKGMVLLNANRMMKRKAITNDQMDKLVSHANYITREKVVAVRLNLKKDDTVKYVRVESEEGVSYI